MIVKKYLLVAILPLIILTSCYQNEALVKQHSSEVETQENNDLSFQEDLIVEYNYTIKGETSDDFFSLISNNPIDLRRKEILEDYDGSSRMIIEIASKYEELWNIEMEVAYNQLLKLLDGEDRQSLLKSQTSWESYMENKKSIEESFYDEHKYDVVGSLRTALAVEENAEETKSRAYSLLEYLYIITGEINMVFSSEEW